MLRRFLVSALATTAVLIAAGCAENSADVRLRKVLGIPETQTLTEELVSERLCGLLPVGTPESALAEKANSIGIGHDRLSSYSFLKERSTSVIRVEFDPNSSAAVKSGWIISLKLDSSQKLESIAVKRYLAGS